MKKVIIVSVGLLVSFSLNAMDQLTYKKATREDSQALLALINQQATQDADKIVILPKKFREGAMQSTIDKGRFFVATTEDKRVVGYKKMFLMNDSTEKNNVLSQEIRATADPVYAGTIQLSNAQEPQCIQNSSLKHKLSNDDVIIYNGSDFTHQDFRKKGINQKLTETAFESITQEVLASLEGKKRLVLIYGLVQANAGDPGSKLDRTGGIAKAFLSFAHNVFGKEQCSDTLEYYRHQAFMPTFDPESQECRPLPDEYSKPGYGCVLIARKKEVGYESDQ